MNKVILIGRLTRDPELRYTQNGTPVANFTLAVDRGTKDNKADFINIIAWNNTAEACAKYIGKGSLVFVEGSMQISSYEDKEGIKRYKTEVIARNVKFLEFKKGEGKKEPAYDEKGNELMEVPF